MPCERHPHPWVPYQDFHICECETICSFCLTDLKQPEALVKHVYSNHRTRHLRNYPIIKSLFQVYLKRSEAVRAKFITSPCRCVDYGHLTQGGDSPHHDSGLQPQSAIPSNRPAPLLDVDPTQSSKRRAEEPASAESVHPRARKKAKVGSSASNHSSAVFEGAAPGPPGSLKTTAQAHGNGGNEVLTPLYPVPHPFPHKSVSREAQTTYSAATTSQSLDKIPTISVSQPSEVFDMDPLRSTLPSNDVDGPSRVAPFPQTFPTYYPPLGPNDYYYYQPASYPDPLHTEHYLSDPRLGPYDPFLVPAHLPATTEGLLIPAVTAPIAAAKQWQCLDLLADMYDWLLSTQQLHQALEPPSDMMRSNVNPCDEGRKNSGQIPYTQAL